MSLDEHLQQTIVETFAILQAQAQKAFHRRVLLLSGEHSWCLAMAAHCLSCVPLEESLYLSNAVVADTRVLPLDKVQQLLGRELRGLVYDAHSGMDPDALAAASGALVGGGVLLLLSPPLAHWPEFADPQYRRISNDPGSLPGHGVFLPRLVRLLQSAPEVCILEQGKAPLTQQVSLEQGGSDTGNESSQTALAEMAPCRSEDQFLVVKAIVNSAHGHRRRPLVVTADRGRGKSTAFGLAAAQLLLQGKHSILISAPRYSAVETVFNQARLHLPGSHLTSGKLYWNEGSMEFMAPDALLANKQEAHLLLVDEAAGIPLAMLEALLHHYPRVAFASTVYGYEGTGRGFVLKFQHMLDRITPQWRALEMKTPIRWAANDPLETLLNRLLLLDAQWCRPTPETVRPESLHFTRLDRQALQQDEDTLRQVFSLLVLSHYRTRPFDLRQLLDAPQLEILVLREGSQVVATALMAREGPLPAALAAGVFQGKRRVQGQLLPQSLVANLALPAAAEYTYGRILRIAVHPEVQRRGIGSRLLEELKKRACANNLDFLGSCFAMGQEVLPFWMDGGYVPVRLGMHREASSGAYPVLMLQAVSESAQDLQQQAHSRFRAQLMVQLTDSHRSLSVALIECLRPLELLAPSLSLSMAQREELEAFAYGQRGYEDSLLAITELVQQAFFDRRWNRLSAQASQLLIQKVLQRQRWPALVSHLGVSGKGEVLYHLRQAVAVLLADVHCKGSTDG